MVMTKVWATYNTRCELALDMSLKNLGLDYVDLFLIVRLGRDTAPRMHIHHGF